MTVGVQVGSRRIALSASKQRLRLWLRMLRSTRAIESDLRERLRLTFGVTLPQFDVMAALARKPVGMTMTELSRFLMVSNGNVTGIIERLVGDGIVAREPIEGDRRGVRVRLTDEGADQFVRMAAEHEQWVDDLLSEFSKAEAEVLIGHLDGLASRVRFPATPRASRDHRPQGAKRR